MQEIQLAVVKLIRILLLASIVPFLAILIIAGFNDRVRRIVLWIMAPTAVFAIIAFLILAPRRMSSVEDWNQGMLALMEAFLSGLPFLLLLAVLGVGAYLFGPSLRDRGLLAVQRSARGQYLAELLNWVEPQLSGMVALEGRELPQDISRHVRITGGLGSGKSILIRQTLRQAIQHALADENAPLPVWLDLDAEAGGASLTAGRANLTATSASQVAAPAGPQIQVNQIARSSPVQTRFLGWLLRRESRANHLVFFVDSSVQTYGMTFAASGDDDASNNAASSLARIMRACQPCPFVIAMPPGVDDGTLNHLIEQEQALLPLSEDGIRAGIHALAGDQAEHLMAALLADRGAWHALAARPIFLHWLARFYHSKKRLPQDVRELFRAVVYPRKTAVEPLEEVLTRLAEKNLITGRYWETIDLTEPESAQARAVSALSNAGLLRTLPANPSVGRTGALLCFTHPVVLAYATALAWHTGRVAAFEIETGGQQVDLDGAGPRQAKALGSDPVLADALVFFNNLEADPQRLARMLAELLAELVPGDASADSSSAYRCFLAAQCLLAMAPEKRPPELVERAAVQLILRMAYDAQAARQAWQLMAPLEEMARLEVYAAALQSMDEMRLEQTLRRIVAIADGDGAGAAPSSAPSGTPDVLRSILWYGESALARLVGQVWVGCEPREAMMLFEELNENGPAERREMAIELMGKLPEEAAGSYLNNLLSVESNPERRIAILHSLSACGSRLTTRLLGMLADPHESDLVRIDAARQLARSQSPELRTSGNVRELVRISHLPLPEKARGYLQRLLEALRGTVPDTTSQWEEIVNPYVVGRPVTDPHQFYGREALLRDLQIAVNNGNHVLLSGERRSGKTSLLYRLAAALEEEARRDVPVRAVFFDLMGLQAYEFYETAIRTIIEGLHDPELVADPNVPRPYSDQPFASDLNEVFAYLHNSLGAQCRLALLIDNGDTLLGYAPAMHAALRRILEGAVQHGLVVILAGTDLQQPGRWAHAEPPFYGTFLQMPIPRLTREEAARLITAPVSGTFTYEASAVEYIIQAAQGRPDAIAAVCQKLTSQLLGSGTRTVTAAMAAGVLQEASPRTALLSQAESTLSCLMDWLEAHPDAPNNQVEEQLKLAWTALQKAMLAQVPRARKSRQ